jgi:4-hydroxyphenylacetate 3-monooxygenase
MGIITGNEYIQRLNSLKNEIWFDGKQIDGLISEHPAFKGIIQSKASLYDLQHNTENMDDMTFISSTSQERVGMSFLQPKTKNDLIKRRKMIALWAKQSHGMIGRSPDYLNTVLMSFASSAQFLEGKDFSFANNLKAIYELAMKQDLSFTHTFISPQVNRSQIILEQSKEPISAKVIATTDEGLIIKGARLLATQGGLTDEVLVYSAPRVLIDEEEAFAFSIPSNTKGLKFICRDTFVGGDSFFDHPLSSQYEEMDSIVVFDDVLVPWNRVFFYQNSEMAEKFIPQSGFSNFAIHQVLTRQIVKTEFILGVAELIVKAINVKEYQHIQDKMAEIIIGLETMKALIEKSENDAQLDMWGTMRPDLIPLKVASNLFPKIYPRFIEIIQLIGASGMITLPTENAFDSVIRPHLDQYLQGAFISAEERTKLFRLAWDLTMSPFGTRQTQYERYFYGDPIRLTGDLYHFYPKNEYVRNVRSFLKLSTEE